ncbi:hypothetical protein SODALDRAFT_325790 [Sodiomyces alkalinus F11]|uniref:Uncharacterized protein n=1 Tax=Sodiomyces alkalinus (strain CBS 110278 / VKM F-3762 / F11) TaxID=1314773 RepID=A0A3N2PPM5_SODAK|nr:hypothetical protein SODALDRAFT_325790 [Sodiomyces alkalinus F11]ROT36459.1 hypothetical protein SODALDRAFT_325790 [Sodiomyces alkalinus F11]
MDESVMRLCLCLCLLGRRKGSRAFRASYGHSGAYKVDWMLRRQKEHLQATSMLRGAGTAGTQWIHTKYILSSREVRQVKKETPARQKGVALVPYKEEEVEECHLLSDHLVVLFGTGKAGRSGEGTKHLTGMVMVPWLGRWGAWRYMGGSGNTSTPHPAVAELARKLNRTPRRKEHLYAVVGSSRIPDRRGHGISLLLDSDETMAALGFGPSGG